MNSVENFHPTLGGSLITDFRGYHNMIPLQKTYCSVDKHFAETLQVANEIKRCMFSIKEFSLFPNWQFIALK